jgi:hypothetical protein
MNKVRIQITIEQHTYNNYEVPIITTNRQYLHSLHLQIFQSATEAKFSQQNLIYGYQGYYKVQIQLNSRYIHLTLYPLQMASCKILHLFLFAIADFAAAIHPKN